MPLTPKQLHQLITKAQHLCACDDLMFGKNGGTTAPCGDVITRLLKGLSLAQTFCTNEQRAQIIAAMGEEDLENYEFFHLDRL